MNRWHRFLGVAALWTVALSGQAQTEPAQHCKLELVRLEPLRPGGQMSPLDWRCRSASPQNVFWHSGKDGSWKAIDESVEKSFQEAVKKEPQKYLAHDPIRGVVKLGSKKYGFVLDHKNEKSQQYDRLYFDLNGDGDLTGAKPIDAARPPLPRGRAAPVGIYTNAEFPRVDLSLDVDGKKLDYSFFFRAYAYGSPASRYAYASLIRPSIAGARSRWTASGGQSSAR